ncbi:hypothetical protein RSAG8_04463, partial [Rhizoctonia solani AG-8 WAC10335]
MRNSSSGLAIAPVG